MKINGSFRSTKTFGHELGMSAAFRQWRADSHCKFIHGYALSIGFIFESDDLDVRNWVVDFGSMKSLKQMLQDTFDHKLLVAEDDPQIEWYREAERLGIADVVVLPALGCERFAQMVFECAEVWLADNGYMPRCRLVQVEVREHGANSAIFKKD